jgi:MFS family permease
LPVVHGFESFGTFPIYITFFITGLVRGILSPSQTAMLGQLVPRRLLTYATTWNSTNWEIATVAGPAVGGLIYGFFGVEPSYSAVFIMYLLALVFILTIRGSFRASLTTNQKTVFENIRDYVFRHQILLGAFSLDMFAVLFGGAIAVLPVFASDILQAGPQGLGFLRSCPAVGAILMSLVLSAWPLLRHTGKILLACVAGFGTCIILFALSGNFFLSAFLLMMSGVFDNVSVVIRSSVLQLYTPDEIRGRVASVNSILIGSSNELGAFESGVAAKIMGLVPSVIFGGCMTLLVVPLVGWKAPSSGAFPWHA